MTIGKLLQILTDLSHWGVSGKSMLSHTSGGELCLQLVAQPDPSVHDYLERKGFVLVDGDYIYRPR